MIQLSLFEWFFIGDIALAATILFLVFMHARRSNKPVASDENPPRGITYFSAPRGITYFPEKEKKAKKGEKIKKRTLPVLPRKLSLESSREPSVAAKHLVNLIQKSVGEDY